MFVVQAVEFKSSFVDIATKAKMLAIALKFYARNMTTMSFGEISKLLLMYPTNIVREKAGQCSMGGQAREKRDRDSGKDRNQESDLAASDELGLEELVYRYVVIWSINSTYLRPNREEKAENA